MSKSVSVRDLLSIPAFAGQSEINLIHPNADKLVAPWIYALGIDLDFPVEIFANNHRDLNNNTGIGYRLVGSIRCDREYTHSPLCDVIDRVAVTGYKDPSLTRELCEMMGKTVDFKAFSEVEGEDTSKEELPANQLETNYEESYNLIATLTTLALHVRGGTNVIDYSGLDN